MYILERTPHLVRQPTRCVLHALINYSSAELSCREGVNGAAFVVTYFPKLVETAEERWGGGENRKRERKNGLVSRSKDAQRPKRKYKLQGWGDFQDSVSS